MTFLINKLLNNQIMKYIINQPVENLIIRYSVCNYTYFLHGSIYTHKDNAVHAATCDPVVLVRVEMECLFRWHRLSRDPPKYLINSLSCSQPPLEI